MKNIMLITRRELGSYLKSPLGYVIIAVVLFVDGLLFNVQVLEGGPKFSADVLARFYAYATFMSMVAGILLSMRLIAEEKQMGTLTMLLTAPVRDHEIVLGKFLSALLFFTGLTVLSLYLPALIFVNGKVAIGHIVGGYIGLIMLGAMSISVGMFASSLTRSQIVAAVSGGALMTTIFACVLISKVADPPLNSFLGYLSPQRHLQWQRGVLNTRDIFYYLSGTYLFLVLTTHVLSARRWR